MNEKISQLNNISNIILEKIPELTHVGNPMLRSQAENISYNEGCIIGKKLSEVLLKYKAITGTGVGLAANQIGSSANIFVTYINGISEFFINPMITSFSNKKNLYKENCLSSSHVWCDVERSENIRISYVNKNGEQVINEPHDQFSARLIQHEYDHLQGTVNIDRAIIGTIEYKTGNPRDEKLRSIIE
jgi:peptide deformylase